MTCIKSTNILKYNQATPRYTSYPTAPYFKGITDSSNHDKWLNNINNNDSLSLYIHIPFCPQLCWYCGCTTKITQRYAPVEDYLHLVLREIDILADKITHNPHVTHLHFGGGSPGILRACDFERLIEKVKQRFTMSSSAEIAIELDPREIKPHKIQCYARNGVNRVSLGTQDFNDATLAAINRQQSFELSKDAIDLCRAHGIQNVNMDLLYGLPHQSSDTITQTMQQVVSLQPDRISFFGYAHVPWVKKHMRLIPDDTLPNTKQRHDICMTGSNILQKHGYQTIGIDHFAKPNDPLSIAANNHTLKRNFQGYTTDKADHLIGIGASSISRFKQGYIQNNSAIPLYKEAILSGALPAQKYYEFSGHDLICADIIERLMCDFEINLIKICQKFDADISLFNHVWPQLALYKSDSLLNFDKATGRIKIQKTEPHIVRLVCALFDEYTQTSSAAQPKHSQTI